MNPDYSKRIIEQLKSHGLTDEGEIEYAKNKICNAYAQINDPCSDNFRLSVNGAQDEAYQKQYANGCCGCYDDLITMHSGNTVKFGFNFGH